MGRESRKGLKRMRSLISRMLERTEGTGAVKFRFVFLYPCGMPCITIPCKENVREPEEKRRAALRPIFPVISSLFARSSTKVILPKRMTLSILRQSFPASRVPSSYTQKETRLSFFRASVPARQPSSPRTERTPRLLFEDFLALAVRELLPESSNGFPFLDSGCL